ncbi:hypothetical protein FF011L_14650 [Roseimaritima multifibrata]|uniref:Tetratricopeptide repeat protein n=2 Tax=Roseimaritima multifibrata TaxID=1930274 RepID=A0A517MD14_9BACT|nr:hypothetical protein FF011L_14650 [Roseimaritima multifibrata]
MGRTTRIMKSLPAIFAGFVCSLLLASTTAGQTPDQIAVRTTPATGTQNSWLPQPLLILSGEIVAFDPKQIEIRVGDETKTTFVRVDRVVWLRPGWQESEAQAGATAYAEEDWALAIAKLLQGLKARPPVWRQEWMSALLANAAFQANRYPAGLELIAQLDRQPLSAPVVGLLPITWVGGMSGDAAVAAANDDLQAAEPLVRLASASLLIGTPHQQTAQRTLTDLSADAKRPLVARMADAQLWRMATPVETKRNVERWLQKIDSLPPSVAWGPMAAIAERLEVAGEQERALAMWLSVGLLAPDPDHPLSRKARERAKQILQLQGNPDANAKALQ